MPRLGRAVLCALLAAALAGPLLAAPKPEGLSPLRIGVGGMYPCGLEGVAARLGLPRERIWLRELADPAVLRDYDVVLASSPSSSYPGFVQAFKQFVEGGGRGLIEMWRLQDNTLLPTPIVGLKGPTKIEITDASTLITRGYDPGSLFELYGLSTYTVAEGLPGETVIARYEGPSAEHGDGKPALVLFKMGTGELLFAGPSLGFASSSRGPALERLLANAIEYLCAGKADPRFILPDLGAAPARSPPTHTWWWVERPPHAEPAPEEVEDEDGEPPPVAHPPVDMEELDAPTGDEYDVLVEVQPSSEADGAEPARITFDYRSPKHYAVLEVGSEACALSVASSRKRELWRGPLPMPEGPCTLILKRRPGRLELATPTEVLASVPYRGGKTGRVYLRDAGQGIELSDAVCQPLDRPFFTDDFMRKEDETGPWQPKRGQWHYIDLDNADYSVNGFTYLGRGDGALATTGHWFWENYACSAAVQPLDAAASVGIAANYHDGGGYLLFRLMPAGRAELVRIVATEEEVLASAPARVAPKQWYRPGLRVGHGTVEAFVDGEPVLKCHDPSAGCGGIALWVDGGRAIFDDVAVWPITHSNGVRLPPARLEGTANATLPVNVGALDRQTWASRAVAWVAQPDRPSLLWHRGAYFGDVTIHLRLSPDIQRSQQASLILAPQRQLDRAWRLTVSREPTSGRASVELRRGRKTIGRRAVRLPEEGPAELELTRQGKSVVARWRGKAILRAQGARGDESVGLELVGAPIRPDDIAIESLNVRDYTFAAAPTDWWVSSGDWEVTARWACDERWSWLCGQSSEVACAWNKRRFAGDVVLDYYMAVKHKTPGGDETERSRDLNAALCGDGKDPNSGYSFVLGGDDGVVTSILKRGEVVAQEPKVRVPEGYSVHHQWHHIQVGKIGDRLFLTFENRPVLTWTDPEPLAEGHVGVWTRRSGIMLPRVTIFFEREIKGQLLSLPGTPGRST